MFDVCLILMGQDTDETSAFLDKQLTQRKRKHNPFVSHVLLSRGKLVSNLEQQGISSSTRERAESHKRYAGDDRDDDEHSTTGPPLKRARLTEAT